MLGIRQRDIETVERQVEEEEVNEIGSLAKLRDQ